MVAGHRRHWWGLRWWGVGDTGGACGVGRGGTVVGAVAGGGGVAVVGVSSGGASAVIGRGGSVRHRHYWCCFRALAAVGYIGKGGKAVVMHQWH
ncbi:hypothetical protein CYMTET_56969 [Cymbomonas tetramitiformis]|uniref:Uncharacterized protein n=1 Tax=Cymbomonas tetramitiformis TaxID=36881 RepID=A0AAE0BBA5_9CHLO|nr:hypothetical protein CYMTET_56969 [Cymbomonas tetramitiformis]